MTYLQQLLNNPELSDFHDYVRKYISPWTYYKLKNWFDISRCHEKIQDWVCRAYQRKFNTKASITSIFDKLREEII